MRLFPVLGALSAFSFCSFHSVVSCSAAIDRLKQHCASLLSFLFMRVLVTLTPCRLGKAHYAFTPTRTCSINKQTVSPTFL
jgi:hypothetical protein